MCLSEAEHSINQQIIHHNERILNGKNLKMILKKNVLLLGFLFNFLLFLDHFNKRLKL